MPSFFTQHPYLSSAMLGGPAIAGGAYLGSQLKGSPFLFGKKGHQKNLQRFTPEQQGALSQLLSMGMENANFGPIEQRAREQFQTQTIPSLAERFTSFGGGAGGQRSSAFQGALGRAGSDLESQLAALRSQYGLQQTQLGLTPQFEPMYMQRQPGFLENLGGGLGQSLSMLLPLLMMGA